MGPRKTPDFPLVPLFLVLRAERQHPCSLYVTAETELPIGCFESLPCNAPCWDHGDISTLPGGPAFACQESLREAATRCGIFTDKTQAGDSCLLGDCGQDQTVTMPLDALDNSV